VSFFTLLALLIYCHLRSRHLPSFYQYGHYYFASGVDSRWEAHALLPIPFMFCISLVSFPSFPLTDQSTSHKVLLSSGHLQRRVLVSLPPLPSTPKNARNGSRFTPTTISAGLPVRRIRRSRMGSSIRAGSRRRHGLQLSLINKLEKHLTALEAAGERMMRSGDRRWRIRQ
jgi:hypothetical protein